MLKVENPQIECLIIGEGPEKNSLIKLSKQLNVFTNIKFLDFIKEEKKLFSYVKSSKVFVFPSTREGFGIAVIEANACGKQAVVIDHPDNAAKDLVNENINGYICQLNKEDIAVKIKKALSRAGSKEIEYQCIASAGRYQWLNIIDQVLACYKN